MEILAYETVGSRSKNLSISYDSKNADDRIEVDKFISRIIGEPYMILKNEDNKGERELGREKEKEVTAA